MNGRRSRQLRRLAGVESHPETVKYQSIKHTIRTRTFSVPVTQPDGTVLDVVKASVQTSTWQMLDRPRAMYKQFKRFLGTGSKALA